MSDDLVQRLRAATEGVTEGPWSYRRCNCGYPACKRFFLDLSYDGLFEEPNARFITSARDLIPEAADRIAALEAEVARLREALTPSAETQTAYMGELSRLFLHANLPWVVIKEIMAVIRARAALGDAKL